MKIHDICFDFLMGSLTVEAAADEAAKAGYDRMKAEDVFFDAVLAGGMGIDELVKLIEE